MGKLIEDYYGKAYDIEFGIDADVPLPENIIILQVRPESVWSKKEAAQQKTVASKKPDGTHVRPIDGREKAEVKTCNPLAYTGGIARGGEGLGVLKRGRLCKKVLLLFCCSSRITYVISLIRVG